jgi:hypothetical protein
VVVVPDAQIDDQLRRWRAELLTRNEEQLG